MLQINVSILEYQHTRKIFYAFQQEGPFKDTGNLTTNSLNPNPLFHIEDHDKAADILIKYEDAKGYTNGPFKFLFDITKEKISTTKSILNHNKNSWIMYRNFDNRLLVYFTSILTYAKSNPLLTKSQ
ncbi:MAG: hypothetical protein MK132_02485 [Lentisphaerales bacterium]|nr:hypothetical protein [Lentisphaerales bacterium]